MEKGRLVLRRGLAAGAVVLLSGCSAFDQLTSNEPAPVTTGTTLLLPETTTTTLAPQPTQPAPPPCVYPIQSGDNLSTIAPTLHAADGSSVSIHELQEENHISDPDLIYAGMNFDICVGNGIYDVDGSPQSDYTTLPPTTTQPPAPSTTLSPETTAPAAPTPEMPAGIRGIQTKINQLLAPYGYPELTVDGHFGPLSRQAACAVRMLGNLIHTRADIGPIETGKLMALGNLSVPQETAEQQQLIQHDYWILIDQTCQVLVAGRAGGTIKYVMPISTGSGNPDPEGNPTDTRNGLNEAFLYDPALYNTANPGWHNSSKYPAAEDNPLEGNMYKPVYFSRGQAIHGANTVPTSPASHGCVRTHVGDQDKLIIWLGLGPVTEIDWDLRSQADIFVLTQGQYDPAA